LNKTISILSTAPLGDDVMQEALASGIELDVIPFIEVNYIEDADLADKINDLSMESIAVVFTSKHAVMSVAKMLKNGAAGWLIYCLGNKTKSSVNQYFASLNSTKFPDQIKGFADDAKGLAHIIVKENVKKVVFFCGDKRLDILPGILANTGIDVVEYVVYRTVETPHKLEKEYDRILFFSSSGVSSFFNVNKVKPDVVLYAIGNTTADEIRTHTDNSIIISKKPVKRDVFLEAVRDLSPSLPKGEGVGE
jgi:uroporphyrinogen-III synthase